MLRVSFAAALAAVFVSGATAFGQCRGGASGGQTTAALGGRAVSLGNTGVLTPGLLGQGSGQNSQLAMLQAQMMYQQLMHQQQTMLAMQQKAQADQLAT